MGIDAHLLLWIIKHKCDALLMPNTQIKFEVKWLALHKFIINDCKTICGLNYFMYLALEIDWRAH